jgi:hypothetical protein
MALYDDNLLSLREATQYVPAINGKRHATSTLYRWCRHGINGVKLEYVRIGRNIATTAEALDRFFKALAEADSNAGPGIHNLTHAVKTSQRNERS